MNYESETPSQITNKKHHRRRLKSHTFMRRFSAISAQLARDSHRKGGDDVDDNPAPVVGVQGVCHLVLAFGGVELHFLSLL